MPSSSHIPLCLKPVVHRVTAAIHLRIYRITILPSWDALRTVILEGGGNALGLLELLNSFRVRYHNATDPTAGLLQDRLLVTKPPTLLSSPTMPYTHNRVTVLFNDVWHSQVQECCCRAEESAKWGMGFWAFCLEEAGKSRGWEPEYICRGAGPGIKKVRWRSANAKAYGVNLPTRTSTRSHACMPNFNFILKVAARKLASCYSLN